MQFLLMDVGVPDHPLVEGDGIGLGKLENEVVGRFLFKIDIRGHSAFLLRERGGVGPWQPEFFTAILPILFLRQVGGTAVAAKGNPLAQRRLMLLHT